MFVRLTAIAYRIDSIKNVFDFELTAYPLSLFKEGVMSSAQCSVALNYFLDTGGAHHTVQNIEEKNL